MKEIHSRALETRAIRDDAREVDFVASTEAPDAHDSIVRANWDTSRYEANPVVLWAHESRELPIGVATKVRVVKKELLATVRFVGADVNPKAEQVWQGVKQGVIRGMSAGFYPRSVRYEKQDDRELLVLDDNELLELSITPIPSNPETLAKLRSRALAASSTENVATPPSHKAAERGEPKETNMDFEKECAALKAKLEQRDADVIAREKSVTEERASKAAVERDLAAERAAHEATKVALKTERDAAIVRAVEALVGDKLTPAEKDLEIECARDNFGLWQKRMAARPSLNLRDGKSALPAAADPLAARDLGTASHDDLFDAFSKSLS